MFSQPAALYGLYSVRGRHRNRIFYPSAAVRKYPANGVRLCP